MGSGIPVETALTCHQLHFMVPYSQNVFGRLFPFNQVTLATDNPSIYRVTLSEEYAHCCRHHALTLAQLFELSRCSIDFTFLDEIGKAELRSEFDRRAHYVATKYGIRSASVRS